MRNPKRPDRTGLNRSGAIAVKAGRAATGSA